MRVIRGLSAGLIAVAAGVSAAAALAAPASAAPPVLGATLTLDPASGNGDTNVMATFHLQIPGGGDGCKLKTTFTWDGHLLDRHNTNACTSHHNFQPPRGDRDPGQHTVMAMDDNTHARAVATFTITGAGNGAAAPNRTQTGGQATNDQGGAMTDPTPAAADSQPAAAAPPAAPRSPATVAAKKTAFTGGYAIGFGAVLVLGGVAILIMLLMRGRRGPGRSDQYVELGPDPDLVARFRPGPVRGVATQRTPAGDFQQPPEFATQPMAMDEPAMAYGRTTRLNKPPSLYDE